MAAEKLAAGVDGISGLDIVLARAAVDRRFRQRLRDDPHGAIAEELQIKLAPTFRIKFVEKDPGVNLMLILPDFVDESPR